MKISLTKILGLLVLPCFFIFTACDEDEFLTELNPNNITTDTFWKTQNDFESALTTVYGALQFQAIGGNVSVFEEAKSDVGGTDFWQGPFPFSNLTYGDGSGIIVNTWDQLYIGVSRANQIIENMETINPSIFNDGEQVSITAQARFLRAWFYFRIVHSFGGGVKRLTTPTSVDDFDLPFSSIEEITNDVIIPDLEYAIANLPQEWNDSDKGRVTWGAATAVLGKVHLFGKNYATASDLFKEVIDSGIYSLTRNFQDNFRHDTEFNSESIFEVAYDNDFNPGVNGSNVDDANGPGAEATNIATAYGFLDNGGFNVLLGSYYLHELFINDEVDDTNPINDGNNHSKRLTATLAVPQGEGTWYGQPTASLATGRSGQSAYVRKWSNAYHLEAEPAMDRSEINFRIIRLSDVYLLYAEAVLQSSGDVTEAQTYVDLVRSRAGVKTIEQYTSENAGMIPQLHVSSLFNATGQPMVPLNADNLLTHIMRVERPLELCFEGHRWKDLVRWGNVQEVFNELRAEEVYRNDNFATFNGQAPLFLSASLGATIPRQDLLLPSDNYDSDTHDYWPIPPAEVQTNDGL